MLKELKKIPVFIKRDFQLLLSYKLAFFTSMLSSIFTIFYFVLFGSMFGNTTIALTVEEGGSFISYILVGSIGWGFMWTIMSITSSSLSTEMMLGTLESILVTPTKLITLMLSYTIFGGFFGLATIAVLMSIGYLVFGITVFASANIFTLIIFILSTMMMLGFGLIFGGLTIWLKNIGETVPLLQNIAMFFCGVYFPISVLPAFLQPVSKAVPFYYSIQGLRLSLIASTPTDELIHYTILLLEFSISFILFGIFVLRLGLAKAKKDGSLSFY
jgi:ABC-2 type transport system permease protein